MLRKESVGIANVMRIIQNAGKADWEGLLQKSPEEREEFVNNEDNYPVLFQELSNFIMEKVQGFKGKESYMRIWGNSVICDTLVNSLLQNIAQLDDVFAMAEQCIEKVMALEVDPSA